MKIQMLPATFEQNGSASPRQHLSCLVINDRVAIDAGSLAMGADSFQKENIRDIVLTHAHLDHIAGLPLFIDDLFAVLQRPICVHAAREVINVLEENIFNWQIYPKFSALKNEFGEVLTYSVIDSDKDFYAANLLFSPVAVNHKVPATGFIVSDNSAKIAFTGDTAETDIFWDFINKEEKLDALFIECAFPDNLVGLAKDSFHLTPSRLCTELEKFKHSETPVFVINIKPMYFEKVSRELDELKPNNVSILEVGKVYAI